MFPKIALAPQNIRGHAVSWLWPLLD